MSKKRMLIILGLVIAILPFLGILRSIREALSVLAGLLVSVFAFLLNRKYPAEIKEPATENQSQGEIKTISGIDGMNSNNMSN